MSQMHLLQNGIRTVLQLVGSIKWLKRY